MMMMTIPTMTIGSRTEHSCLPGSDYDDDYKNNDDDDDNDYDDDDDYHNVGLSFFSAVEVKIVIDLNLEFIYWHKLLRQSPPHQAQVNVGP